MISRRSILALPLAVAACGSLPSGSTIALAAYDTALIAKGLNGVLTQLTVLQISGLTPSILDTCNQALTGLQGVAQALYSASSVSDAQPLVQKVEGYVNAIVGALAALPLPPDVSKALAAAAILLPIVEVAVGLVMQTAPPAPAVQMTPDQARSTLAGS
jgi:hypothetical protein